MDGAAESRCWNAVVDLGNELFIPGTPQQVKNPPSESGSGRSIYSDLQKHWVQPYFGRSLQVLQDTVNHYERKGFENTYARTLVFVQSSGTGKSRLADAYGERCPMIHFIVSKNPDTFPPRDWEIFDFLRRPLAAEERRILLESPSVKRDDDLDGFPSKKADAVWNHSKATAFLQASFEICKYKELILFAGTLMLLQVHEWLEEQDLHTINFEEMAAKRHADMAPSPEQDIQASSSSRSEDKAIFCRKVAERGLDLANALVLNKEWRDLFNQVEESRVRQSLVELSGELEGIAPLFAVVKRTVDKIRTLQNTPSTGPLLVFAIDEASNLLIPDGEEGMKTGLYVAMNRILSCLKGFPIWFFFLSTESKVESLVPANEMSSKGNFVDRSSSRFFPRRSSKPSNKGVLQRIPPYLALELDIGDRQKMHRNPEAHLETKLSDFGKPNYMALFGRPLWSAYTDRSDEMYHVARQKLIGGVGEYNADDRNHVFAVLSFRLALDVCIQNPISLPLSRMAVNSYMRVVLSMDPDSGVLDTITPTEPILAKAAMEHLCRSDNWKGSIRTLTGELLEKGLVEKGLKGELFARIVLILAHDCVRGLRSDPLEYIATYSVADFLFSLYGDAHEDEIRRIDPIILDARLNFNHFAVAGENLNSKDVITLCRDLLRRQAALQLVFQQPRFDILIPCHIGDGKIEEGKISVIAIQVKNKEKQASPSKIFSENFQRPQNKPRPFRATAKTQRTDFEFNEIAQPVLILLFDLSADSPSSSPVEVLASKSSKSPALWLVHSRGHDEKVFGCLKTTSCSEVCKLFFTMTTQEYSPHDNLARRNWVFRELGEKYRYDSGLEEGPDEEQDQKSDDIEDESKGKEVTRQPRDEGSSDEASQAGGSSATGRKRAKRATRRSGKRAKRG